MKRLTGIKHRLAWTAFLLAGMLPFTRVNPASAYTDLNAPPGPVIDNPGYKRIQYDDPKTTEEAWTNLNNDWTDFMQMFMGIGLLSSVGIFIYLMIRLAGASDNPYERQKVQKDILILLIVTACLGGIGTLASVLIQTTMM